MKINGKKLRHLSDQEEVAQDFFHIPHTESDSIFVEEGTNKSKTTTKKSSNMLITEENAIEKSLKEISFGPSSSKKSSFKTQLQKKNYHPHHPNRTSIQNINFTEKTIKTLKSSQRSQKSSQNKEQYLRSLHNQKKQEQKQIIFEKKNLLGEIVKGQKIKLMIKNFIKKIGRNNIYSVPVMYDKFSNYQSQNILDILGFKQIVWIDNLFAVFNFVLILILLIVQSLSLVFQSSLFKEYLPIQIISICFFACEIVYNMATEKVFGGKKLQKLRQIWRYEIFNELPIDMVSLFVILLDVCIDAQWTSFTSLLLLLKLSDCLSKVQKLEVYLIKNFHYEQYWSLVKVFFFNFAFAHILAIILVAITNINPNNNWMQYKAINDAPWYQQYTWAYYWGINIMLTVGFGDIIPTNYKEALCVLFIEIISCIVLAYNVNCVGTLITNIRMQDTQKSQKFKLFKRLTDSNSVPPEVSWKINNYIQESANLKKKFNFEEEHNFVEKLPDGLQKQYKIESNKNIFTSLIFFKGLLEKSINNFAQAIEMKISHPQEIVKDIEADFNIIILKSGKFGYICKKSGCCFNDLVADQIAIEENGKPFLTSLDFLTKNRSNYEIKSLEYSMFYLLPYEEFIKILKESKMDYELYCQERDKIKNILNQFEVFQCQFCEKKHLKFQCPKLHYVPYKQIIINKYLHKCKTKKCERQSIFERPQKVVGLTPMQLYQKVQVQLNKNSKLKSMLTKSSSNYQKTKSYSTKNLSRDEMHLNSQQIKCYSTSFTLEEECLKKMLEETNLRVTKDIISNEFMKLKNQKECSDEIWNLSLDQAHNYHGYFSINNSSNLHNRFDPENRQSKAEDLSCLLSFNQNTTIAKETQKEDSSQIQSIFRKEFIGQ